MEYVLIVPSKLTINQYSQVLPIAMHNKHSSECIGKKYHYFSTEEAASLSGVTVLHPQSGVNGEKVSCLS